MAVYVFGMDEPFDHPDPTITDAEISLPHGGAVKITMHRRKRIRQMMEADAQAKYVKSNPTGYPSGASLEKFGDFAREYLMYEEAADNLNMAEDSFLRAQRLWRSVKHRN